MTNIDLAPGLRKVGEQAPLFVLPDQDNQLFHLESQKGKWLVIYFYPRALTPGCTQQACEISAQREDWTALGAQVVGISVDTPSKLAQFKVQESLYFTLLSDVDHQVAELYGAWQERSMYGKTYMGVARMTYIVDPEGRIAHVIPAAKPKTHADDVRAWLQTHQQRA